MRFPKKCGGTCYAEHVFLHPMGSAGQVVHSAKSVLETSTHYFLCSGGPGMVLHPVGSAGHIVHYVASVCETSTHYFSYSGGLVRFPKKCTGTRYTELVFLFPVGYVGHVVHCGTSGARNIDALFFILGWGPMWFRKKCGGTCYAEHVFLHPMGSAGQVVHSAKSGRETSTHYFLCSGGLGAVLLKSVPGHVTPNLCFCIRWDQRVTVHSTASGAQNIEALFFMLGCPWCSFQKLRRTCVFVSGGIYGSCSALRYIRGTKYRCTIFLALVGPKRI
jgi:hypothetical protein